MTSLLYDLQQARAYNTTDKNLPESVRTALVYKKNTSKQHSSSFVKKCEKLVVDEAAIDAEIGQNRTDMNILLGWLQAFIDDRTRRADEEEKEHRWLILSRKSGEVKFRHSPDNSEKVEDLLHELDGAVANGHRAQKAVTSLQSRSDSVPATADKYRRGYQTLPNV